MVGMNTLGTDAQSVGLAIPSATILTVLNGYLKNKSIIRPRLGVVSQEINPIRKIQFPWLPVDYGEFVGSLDINIPKDKVISAGSSANEAGIKYGDIILDINGEKLVSKRDNPTPLRRNILNKQAGEIVEITILKGEFDTKGEVSYPSKPTQVKVKLKGVGYDLVTNKNILVS
jgi:S1-C subfamily serine protease